ncbi:PrsW family intramembrane metalloprotease [Cellulosimicrobium marinum]|uniref:PrsW family intramembrane metalloprotease n=1 Tax=Cellulosimicrobium marinum TaxID=1638992 RepID=UPI001E3E07C4|nr:PrsW family intramembrane metalloprotease [Cellulosimicrobium marinum]MCB7136146.1 PrsW family intramembrane metalloprotease [Cellulosimicrobium marinum]
MTYPQHGHVPGPPPPGFRPPTPAPPQPALDPRAVLHGRVPGRAPVGVIVAIAVSSVCLLLGLWSLALAGGGSFGLGLILALLPLGVWLPVVLALDRLEPEPPSALVVTFLWGAGVATLLAGLLNSLGMELVAAPLLGQETGWYAVATVVAPVTEEILKGAVLFGMLWFRRHELDGWTDGVIYAAVVGLGFAAVENVQYFIMAAQTDALGSTFVLRAVVSPLLHPLCTALTGLGIASAAMTPRGPRRVLAPLGGLAAAMALHALWNGATGFGVVGLAFAYLAGLGVLVTVVLVLRADRRRTVATVDRHLAPYQATGLVTPADLAMLSTLGTRRRARGWARRTGGPGAARAMRDYQQAATELALLHDRVARGIVEPGRVEGLRRALLSLMGATRAAFLARAPQAVTPGGVLMTSTASTGRSPSAW